MVVKPSMNEAEQELSRALCNFTNEAGDPFPPASQWDENVWRAFRRLSDTYNRWYESFPQPKETGDE